MAWNEKIIIALDVDSRDRALQFVEALSPLATYFKIGSQLFTACGPALIRDLAHRGLKIFLDLKFHDIPQTVAKAVAEAARLKVAMLNVHASGGMSMLQAATRPLADIGPEQSKPHLIAVTMLTSISEAEGREIGFSLPPAEQAVRLALMAHRAGLDGVVASPLEIEPIRKACGDKFLIVSPGIRPEHSSGGDQVRIATPQAALQAGADYLVIGRPILEARDPRAAFQEILDSLN